MIFQFHSISVEIYTNPPHMQNSDMDIYPNSVVFYIEFILDLHAFHNTLHLAQDSPTEKPPEVLPHTV